MQQIRNVRIAGVELTETLEKLFDGATQEVHQKRVEYVNELKKALLTDRSKLTLVIDKTEYKTKYGVLPNFLADFECHAVSMTNLKFQRELSSILSFHPNLRRLTLKDVKITLPRIFFGAISQYNLE